MEQQLQKRKQQHRSSDADETGIEEPMWRLGLDVADASADEEEEEEEGEEEEPRAGGGRGGSGTTLPERPGEPICSFYLRTGSCGYGDRCRYHHPRDRTAAAGGEFPERIGQPICQYFMKTGSCKFGVTCKYHHPNLQPGSGPHPVQLNYQGYPLRPGGKECAYYVKTGNCKFGVTCKFHHPPSVPPQFPVGPTFAAAAPPSPQPYAASIPGWPVPRGPTYLQGSYPYTPVAVPIPLPTWSPYPPHGSTFVSSGPVQTVQAGSMYGGGTYSLPASPQAYTGPYPSAPSPSGYSSNGQKEHNFPERPGQPECQFYMRTGDCKYGPSCKYHHPPAWNMPKTGCALSPLGLPLRPGAPRCTFFAQNGVCKFGPTCKFDHPMGSLSYSPSASSLPDMAVAPYPVGFSMAALVPSTPSSDIQHEYFGGAPIGDSFSIRASPSGSRSSGSSHSMLSSGYQVSQSLVQAPIQNSIPCSSSSDVHGIEITGSS